MSTIQEEMRKNGDLVLIAPYTPFYGVSVGLAKSGRQYTSNTLTGEVWTYTPDQLQTPSLRVQAEATYTPAPDPDALLSGPAPAHTLKLGKLPYVEDTRHFALANYLDLGRLLTPPTQFNLGYYVRSGWGVDGNDQVGDCTIASAAHQDMIWSALNTPRTPIVPTTNQCLQAYSLITGYRPDDPSTDQGALISDVLAYWRKVGMPWGTKIGAYALLNRKDQLQVKQATYIFGGLHLGVQLPITAQSQIQAHQPWDTTQNVLTGNAAPGSWGGHDVPVVGYGPQGISVVTWGQVQMMTWRFFMAYVDEAWAIISQEFMNGNGNNLAGFNLATLRADLALVGKVQ